MALIVETWTQFSIRAQIRLETRITSLFRDAILDREEVSQRSWFVTLEDPLNDPHFGTELGRNDLRFYPQVHNRQTVYFTVECKRLRVRTPSGFDCLATDYVKSGMQRFISGYYSRSLPCGGMLAYVMDNQLNDAMIDVLCAIDPERSNLGMPAIGAIATPSALIPAHSWSLDSQHQRANEQFAIYHALVPIDAQKMAVQPILDEATAQGELIEADDNADTFS